MRLVHVAIGTAIYSMVSTSLYAATSQSAGMMPGLWQITLQTTSPVAGPPTTHAICVDRPLATRADAPKTKSKDDCQVFQDASAANETAFSVRCAKAKTSSASRVTYFGDHFAGTIVMTNPAGGEIHQDYSGVRIGDCEDTDPPPPLPQPPPPPVSIAPTTPPAQ